MRPVQGCIPDGMQEPGNWHFSTSRYIPNRDAQFEHINAVAKSFLSVREPVISVDCKKKELIGAYKNNFLNVYISMLMEVEATVREINYGKKSCKNSPINTILKFM